MESLNVMPLSDCLEIPDAVALTAGPEQVNCIQPLLDARWDEFLQRHPRASVFHSTEWLKALWKTYGYKPVVYTTSPAGQALQNGVVFCKVESWLTGSRLVSLPFSDHCDPLVDREPDLDRMNAALEREFRRGGWRYIELRPLQPLAVSSQLRHATLTYSFHQLDLAPSLDTLFRNCHKDSTQRKIRRAAREGLKYREGSSEELLNHFYQLFKVTRKRHKLPPQPRKWFANLIRSFGDALKLRVAFKDDRAVAAIITIRFKDTMVYKYGGSDSRFNNLGSMHFLLWHSIQEARAAGLRFFDFGRTNAGQQGLVTFKNRWGATQSTLTYSRYALRDTSAAIYDLPSSNWKNRAAQYLLGHLSTVALSILGEVLYPHVG